MGYLDCYTQGDLEGHPSTTYMIDVNDPMTKQAITMLKNYYERVDVVEKTQGQSPLLLSVFMFDNKESLPPTLQNVIENITSQSVATTIIGEMS